MSKNARMMENIELQQFYDRFYGKKSSSMQNERVLTITASAMGRLYKELIKTIGIERTKGFLLRYGWNCGVSDALNIVDTYGRKEECLAVGPLIHTMHGFQDGHKIDRLEVDFAKGKLNLEGIWWNSYEALQYIKLFGKSSEPICHTLTGLASGYLSTIMGEKVIAKEVECQAMGHSHCRVVCRTVKDWGKEIEAELKFYEIDDLIQELDQTYEQLKKERDNLNRTFDVHEKLMKEILRDTSLNSLAELLYKTTNLPAVIEDINHQILAVAGMPEDDKEIKQLLSLQHTNKTKYFHISDELGILKSPIYLDQKIVAYYTFFYQQSQPQEIDKMIIERAALTSSLSLLKERIRFQSEQRVRGSFLEDMISGAWTIEEMTKRAYYLGIKLTPPYRMLAVEAFSQPSFIHKLEFNDEVISALGHYFKDHGINAFIGQKSQNIIILCAGNASLTKQKELQSLSHKISTYLMRKFPQNRFKFGISTLFPYSI